MSHAIRMGMVTVALMLAYAGPAAAVERFVRPDADPTCAATPNCHLTIDAAVTAAGNGDVITIGHNGGAPYTENVAIGGRTDVTFRGQPGARPAVAAIAANDAPVLFVSAGAQRTAIEHLTLSASPGDAAVRVGAGTAGVQIS